MGKDGALDGTRTSQRHRRQTNRSNALVKLHGICEGGQSSSSGLYWAHVGAGHAYWLSAHGEQTWLASRDGGSVASRVELSEQR